MDFKINNCISKTKYILKIINLLEIKLCNCMYSLLIRQGFLQINLL